MKTATITFHAPNNNGSFLQAYALQYVLVNHFNVENEIIDFRTEKQIQQYSLIRKISSPSDMLRNIVSLLHYKKLKCRYDTFENMRKKYFQMTTICNSEKQVKELVKRYDLVICGSDQIWNTKARDFSKTYLLPDVNVKKISYAVSCGSFFNQINKEEIVSGIKEFEKVSVREKEVADSLNNSLSDKVEITLDPTFLLKKTDYFSLYTRDRIINEKYIFLYTINYSENILRTAQMLAKEYKLKIYTPFTSYSAIRCKKYGINILYDIAPNKYLNLLDNAEYVLSNSFHGIAFSIIFRKNFYRICDVKDSILEHDDRIDGILDALGLQERTISYMTNLASINNIIDYSDAELKLSELQKKSLDFLKSALQ